MTRLHRSFCFLASVAVLGLAAPLSAQTIVDRWEFTHPDGTGMGAILSNNGLVLGGNSAIVDVQGGRLRFFSDIDGVAPETASTFRGVTPTGGVITSGLLELSWAYTAADFTNTALVAGTANTGFALRDATPTNSDAGMRLRFNGTDLILQYQDSAFPNFRSTPLLTIPGSQLTQTLSVRLVVDVDNAGTAGSVQAFYTLGAASEVHALTDGVLGAGFSAELIRVAQQTTNGGANWRAGDQVFVDDLTLTLIPEPSAALLVPLGGYLLLAIRRRRRA